MGRIYQRIFNPFHRYLFCICHEQEWCMQLSTCYSFQFSPKTRQTMPLYDYLTPKLDFKRKLNHRQSFLYKGRLTVRTIRKFRMGSSLWIESRIGSSIRNRIESRSFAGPYSMLHFKSWLRVQDWSNTWLLTRYNCMSCFFNRLLTAQLFQSGSKPMSI